MKAFPQHPGWRFWALALACGLLAASLVHPNLPWRTERHRYLMVLDITQSMNARDYHLEGMPGDRLGFVKEALRRVLAEMPCGTEVGLGLFTTQHTQILFSPLELCEHYAVIDDVLNRIDWRMAWAADSHIGHGIFAAVREISERDPTTRLVFFTDGQQYPGDAEPAYFHGVPGQIKGLLVGVGGVQPVPIPKLDRENRPLGFWEYADLQNYTPSPTSPQARSHDSTLYRSRLDEANLLQLAQRTGLGYHRLVTPEGLLDALSAKSLAQVRTAPTDLRWFAALVALAALLATTGLASRKRVPRLRGERA